MWASSPNKHDDKSEGFVYEVGSLNLDLIKLKNSNYAD